MRPHQRRFIDSRTYVQGRPINDEGPVLRASHPHLNGATHVIETTPTAITGSATGTFPRASRSGVATRSRFARTVTLTRTGARLTEPDSPDSATLLYVTGSTLEVEQTLQEQGFELLRIDEA